MGRYIFGAAIGLVGVCYLVAVWLAIAGSGDPLNHTNGISMESVINGLILLPIGVLILAAAVSVIRPKRP